MATDFSFDPNDGLGAATQGLLSVAGAMGGFNQRQNQEEMAALDASLQSSQAAFDQQNNILDIRSEILRDAQARLENEQALTPDETSRMTQAVSAVINSVFAPGSSRDRQREGVNMIEEEMRTQANLLQNRRAVFQAANQLQDATQMQASEEADFVLQPLLSQVSTYAGSENWAGMYAARRQIIEHPLFQHARQTKVALSDLDQGLKNWGTEISSDGRELTFHDVIRMTGSSDPAEVKEAYRILAIRSENSEGFINSIPDGALGGRGPVFRAQLSSFVRENPRISEDDLNRYQVLENQYLSQLTSQFGNDPVLAAQMIGSEATKKALSSIKQGVLAKRGSNLADFLPPIDASSLAVDDVGIRNLSEYVKQTGARNLDSWITSIGRGAADLFTGGPESLIEEDASLQPFLRGGAQAQALGGGVAPAAEMAETPVSDFFNATGGVLLASSLLSLPSARDGQILKLLVDSGMTSEVAKGAQEAVSAMRNSGVTGKNLVNAMNVISTMSADGTMLDVDEIKDVLYQYGARGDVNELANKVSANYAALTDEVTPSKAAQKALADADEILGVRQQAVNASEAAVEKLQLDYDRQVSDINKLNDDLAKDPGDVKVRKELEQAKRKKLELAKQLSDAENAAKKSSSTRPASLKRRQEVDRLSKSVKRAQDRVTALTKEAKAAKEPSKLLTRQISEATAELTKLETQRTTALRALEASKNSAQVAAGARQAAAQGVSASRVSQAGAALRSGADVGRLGMTQAAAQRLALRGGARAVGGTLLRVATGPVGAIAGGLFEVGSAAFKEVEISRIQSSLDSAAEEIIQKRNQVLGAASAPQNSALRSLLPKNLDSLARSVEMFNVLSARMGADVVLDLPNLFGKGQYAALYARMVQSSPAALSSGAADLSRLPSPAMASAGLTNPSLLQTQVAGSMPQTFPAGSAMAGAGSSSALSRMGTPSQMIGE